MFKTWLKVATLQQCGARNISSQQVLTKPKNQQKTETNQSETFSIDFYQIKKFGAVLLSPPTAPEDLDPTIEELKKKQKAYIEAGDAELKKETSDLEKRIEYEVE